MSAAPVSHPQDLRAAEHALGVLEGAAQAEALALIDTDPSFAAAVESWQLRLAALADDAPELQPPPRVWEAIRTRLAFEAANDDVRWWNRVDVWRGLTAASVAVGAIAIGMLVAPDPDVVLPKTPAVVATAPLTAVVAAPDGGAKLAAITVDKDMGRVVVTPLGLTDEAARSLELWVVPGDGSAPRSLGLVKASGATVIEVALPVEARGAALAISREPAGGSPTGAPTGPILGVGPLTAS